MSFIIEYSPRFKRSLRKLPENIQVLVFEKFDVFEVNIFDHSLDTHKLQGKMQDLWSFSVNYKYRVVFRIIGKIIRLDDVGDHGLYSRFR